MSLTINNNAMAANASRNLSNIYGKLSTSVRRLSSGLRVNSAADDAAGLAIREMMRADVATVRQGIRNASDGISLIQTADGALSIIDEKLTRMRELAEQAATGTYTTVQRLMINSEYQAMAAEIDRIAQATNFNGIKLLDGSVSNQHGGQGLKIHFGASNQAAEDYYFVNIGDARATSTTGLRVGGDAQNDVWGQGAAGPEAGPGCCVAGFSSLNEPAGFISGQTFSFGYNWDWMEDRDPALLGGRYLAGRYQVGAGDSLQDLVNKVNEGTQSRVGLKIDSAKLGRAVFAGGLASVCIGDEAFVFASANVIVSGPSDNLTFYTTAVEADASYNALVSYFNVNGYTMAFDTSDSLVNQALNNLGKPVERIPGNRINGLELAEDSLSYIKGLVEPQFQDEIDSFVASNWNADRVELGAVSRSTSQITDDIWAGVQSQLPPNTYNTSGEVCAGLDFMLRTGVYGDFSNPGSPKGVISDDPDLIRELGLTELVLRVTTNSPGPSQLPTSLSVYAGGVILDTSIVIDPAFPFKQADLYNAITAGSRRALSNSSQVIELQNNGAYAGPTVDPDLINVDVFSTTQPLNLKDKRVTVMSRDPNGRLGAEGLAEAINRDNGSRFWAMVDQGDPEMLYVFAKEGGDNNSILACESGARGAHSRAALECFSFLDVESGQWNESGASFSLGGQDWARLRPVQTKSQRGQQVWNVTLNGRDVGSERDLWIANRGELKTPGLEESIINGMDRDAFSEIQNASDAPWAGAEVRTQSSAQQSLDALSEAITLKDKIRADLGALQNRLENTITNLEIQTENLLAAESRISDVDVAKEMTEFTKNNVLTQAAVSMLSQANSMSQLALSLIG